MKSCKVRLIWQVILGIFQGLLVLTQGAMLNYYIISHYSASINSYFFFLGDFVCVFVFAGTLAIAYRYLVEYRREKDKEQAFMYSPKRFIAQYPVTKLGVLPLIYVSWAVYAVLLLGKLAVIFTSQIPEHLSEKAVAGPQLLKVTIAMSGIVFLILIESHNWAERGSPRYEYVTSVCTRTGIEVLDTVSFLSIIIVTNDEDVMSYTPGLETAIVILSGINILLPVLILYKLSLGESSCQKRIISIRLLHAIIHLCFIDIPFFAIRLYLWVAFHHNASIFLMKNVFGIINSLRSIYPDLLELCCHGDDDRRCIDEYLAPDKIRFADVGSGDAKTTDPVDELKRINAIAPDC